MGINNNSTSNTIQTFWVFLGSLSSVAFALVSSMILSRYFEKADYGTYKQIMYVYGVLLSLFTLGLPRAYSYFLPRVENDQAKSFISKLNWVLIGLGCALSILIYFGAEVIASALKNPTLGSPLRYFALVPLFMLPTMGLDGILATYKQTLFLGIYKTLTQVFKLLCVVIPVVFFNGGIKMAIIGFTVASFLCFVVAMFLKHKPVRKFSKNECSITYNEIFKYAIPIMGATLWGVVISAADQFFISRYFGTKVFAEFANGSLRLPFVGMMVAATSTVLFPVFSKHAHNNEKDSKNEIIRLWHSVFEKTVKLIYPIVLFCLFFATPIMVLLYGQNYVDSGMFFQIKLYSNFFIVIAFGPLLLSVGGERIYYRIHAYGAILLILLELAVVSFWPSPYLLVVVSVICEIGRIVISLVYIAKYFDIKLFKLFPIKLILKILIPSVIILLCTRYVFVNLVTLSDFLTLLISGIVYLFLGGAWAYFGKIDYLSIFKPLLNKIQR